MSMQDPISDMFTRIRNAQAAEKVTVTMPSSKKKMEVARVLLEEGYINGFRSSANDDPKKPELVIELRYYQGKPVIETIKGISLPSLRVYKGYKKFKSVKGGLGIAIVSTSKGLMTDRAARAAKLGGEVLAEVF